MKPYLYFKKLYYQSRMLSKVIDLAENPMRIALRRITTAVSYSHKLNELEMNGYDPAKHDIQIKCSNISCGVVNYESSFSSAVYTFRGRPNSGCRLCRFPMQINIAKIHTMRYITEQEYMKFLCDHTIIEYASTEFTSCCGPHEFSSLTYDGKSYYKLHYGWYPENKETIYWWGISKVNWNEMPHRQREKHIDYEI